MPIELSPEDTTRAIASLRRYCDEQLDEKIGELKARLFLEFILKEIGPSIYNGAIGDAQAYFRDRVADLEGACSQQEFDYWPRSTARRPSP
ncbi:MAG: DUF2164 domain-containing protein [Gemmatimonadetes bacterium]|jgi:uncharacterized protein (DUF2164 family)|nr:DUF2164 domain-containing protein [Gemmatimonadota bacterium]MBP9107458.1 DUF2164 domain-containing protein [Gemmatimonadaceae bacterium]MBK6458994.1 DUF2164 domain-containing protein [Gemmatimonadota bacterium]MBK6844809.1 DUF2164 domain-containing protein [Gemmatimonadota bacterium]MBK7834266.1 DUF2164 domain-containing protein [Gemmatimonadota bacterium]